MGLSAPGTSPEAHDPPGASPNALGWLEISLLLDGELVEPASELLGRVAPAGLVIEPFGDHMLVRAWLPRDDQLQNRLDRLERGLWHLGQIVPFPQPNFKEIPEQDWEAAWKHQFRPLPIGQRLLIQPVVPRSKRAEAGISAAGSDENAPFGAGLQGEAGSGRSPDDPTAQPAWNDALELISGDHPTPPDPNRLNVYLEPGMAFGTGTHPTTRHCLELLEEWVRPGNRVLDLGCGSGILAIAAVRLGAERALALDTDPDAVELARANVRHNSLNREVQVEHGSLAEVPQETKYSLIVANIHAAVIQQLLKERLAGHLAKPGRMIVSGILDEQQAAIERLAIDLGLQIEQVRRSGDWRTLVLRED